MSLHYKKRILNLRSALLNTVEIMWNQYHIIVSIQVFQTENFQKSYGEFQRNNVLLLSYVLKRVVLGVS